MTGLTVRTAEKPGHTVNIDIALVPVSHEADGKLPAVSCSTGKLVVEKPKEEDADHDYPGRIFEQEALRYEDAMKGFLVASEAHAASSRDASHRPETENPASLNAQQKAFHLEEAELRTERRTVRKQREEEDGAWAVLRVQRNDDKDHQKGVSSEQRKAQDAYWKHVKAQRQEQKNRRHAEDTIWRQTRRDFKERTRQLPMITAWIAIVVILDNCTRQCLGWPLFIEGSSITATFIVEALHGILPAQLQFVITDRGPQFKAARFKKFLLEQAINPVFIAKHRPQSNGIAERFVRTLKEWLHDKTWGNSQEVKERIEICITEYNDRPHQGLPITGLSPTEFANRLAGYIMMEGSYHSTCYLCD